MPLQNCIVSATGARSAPVKRVGARTFSPKPSDLMGPKRYLIYVFRPAFTHSRAENHDGAAGIRCYLRSHLKPMHVIGQQELDLRNKHVGGIHRLKAGPSAAYATEPVTNTLLLYQAIHRQVSAPSHARSQALTSRDTASISSERNETGSHGLLAKE